jgi:hypothetical protein
MLSKERRIQMLIIEYDHRSIKIIPGDGQDFNWDELQLFISYVKKLVPPAVRVYNPVTHVWFITEPYIKELRRFTAALDCSWEKRL